VSDMGRDKLN